MRGPWHDIMYATDKKKLFGKQDNEYNFLYNIIIIGL